MNSIRNNLDSPPPEPRRAWSGQESTPRTVTDHSWMIGSSEDTPNVDSSFEIVNTFGSVSDSVPTTPTAKPRPMTSPHSSAADLDSPSLDSCSDKSLSSEAISPTSTGPVPVPRRRTNSQILAKTSRDELENRKLVRKVEELQTEKSDLETQVLTLQVRVSDLESSKKALVTQNLRLQRTQAKRVPELEMEMERLTQELSQAQIQSSSVLSDSASERNEVSTEIEELISEVNTLKTQNKELQTKLSEAQFHHIDPPSELNQVRAELEQRAVEVSALRAQKKDLEAKMSAMTLKSYDASISSLASKSGAKPKRVEIRLNEALKQLKEAEQEKQRLREQLHEQGSMVTTELTLTKGQLERVTKEKEELQEKQLSNALKQTHKLNQQLSSAKSEHDLLRSDHTLKCEELSKLRRTHTQLQQQSATECQDLLEQLEALQEEYDQYKQSCSSTEEENSRTIEQLTSAMTSLREQLRSAKKDRDDLSDLYEKSSEDYRKVFDSKCELERSLSHLRGARQQDTIHMQKALEEVKKEAGETLGDYNATVERLTEVEREKDEYRMKNERSMGILAARNEELAQIRRAMQESERNWSKTLEDRLGKQKEEAEQLQQLTAAQMATYRDDFNDERKAREKMADEKMQLTAALQIKNEEIRVLRLKLNEQAAQVMQDDFEQSQFPEECGPPLRAHDPYQQVHFQGGQQRQNY